MRKFGNTADEETAARIARENAEHIRRAEILDKIHKLEKERVNCESCVGGLSSAAGALDGRQADISAAFTNFQQNSLTRDITISGIFEGMGAVMVKEMSDESVEEIGSYTDEISNVLDALEAQIGKLQMYIDELETEITNLKAAL